jgi:hypothetical protein
VIRLAGLRFDGVVMAAAPGARPSTLAAQVPAGPIVERCVGMRSRGVIPEFASVDCVAAPTTTHPERCHGRTLHASDGVRFGMVRGWPEFQWPVPAGQPQVGRASHSLALIDEGAATKKHARSTPTYRSVRPVAR